MLSSRPTGGHRKTNNLDEVLPFNFFFFTKKWLEEEQQLDAEASPPCILFLFEQSCPPPPFISLFKHLCQSAIVFFFSLTFSASFLFAQCSASTIFFLDHFFS